MISWTADFASAAPAAEQVTTTYSEIFCWWKEAVGGGFNGDFDGDFEVAGV